MSSVRRVNAGRRLGVFAWLLGLALAGCVTYPKPTAPVTLPAGAAATRAAASSPAEYRLRVHDELDVKFFHNPELNESLVVRPDGRISLQLIGDIPAAGLTPSQLQRNVLKRYTPILRYPEPTVIVKRLAPQRVYIGGEVQLPGTVSLDTHLSVLQAIFQVGGFKFNANRGNVVVFRNTSPSRTDIIVLNLDSQLEPARYTAADCKKAAAPSQGCAQATTIRHGDLRLEPDDIVFVPQTSVGRLAEFIEKNLSKIVPIYTNMGLNFNYELKRDTTTTIRTVP